MHPPESASLGVRSFIEKHWQARNVDWCCGNINLSDSADPGVQPGALTANQITVLARPVHRVWPTSNLLGQSFTL